MFLIIAGGLQFYFPTPSEPKKQLLLLVDSAEGEICFYQAE